jgi:glycosyltransferase involved in cell wall biosynthesis
MKILDVSPKVVLPPNTGSRVRMYNLLRHLSRDHEVRQFSQQRIGGRLREHVNEVWATPTYCEIQYAHPAVSALGHLAEAPRIGAPTLRGAGMWIAHPSRFQSLMRWSDVVLVEFPWQFAYCSRNRGKAPLVLASHNVEADRFASVAQADRGSDAKHRWRRWIERVERRAVREADLVLAVSPDDRAAFIDRYNVDPDRIVVVPNGADTSQCAPVDAAAKAEAKRRLGLPQKPTVLYTGSNTAPNRAGLRWVRRLAERAPHLSFVVVGELSTGVDAEPFIGPGVVNDITQYLDAADIAICPIEFGGGTKIKVLEAMAAGLPTIAFHETVQGLDVRDGEEILVTSTSEPALIAALEDLVSDPEAARKLGAAGREFVAAHHEWRHIARELETLLLALCGQGASAAQPDVLANI